jgi:hypothetical protein
MEPARLDWYPILTGLTRDFDDWFVCKHLSNALQGRGDVDGMAPSGEAEAISDSIAGHVVAVGDRGVMSVCDHVPGIRLQFLFLERILPRVEQIDTYFHFFRAATPWGHAARLRPLTEMRDGIRTVPGDVEAIIDLVFSLANVRIDPVESARRLSAARDAFHADPQGIRGVLRAIAPPATSTTVVRILEDTSITPDVQAVLERRFRNRNRLSSLRYPVRLVHRAAFSLGSACELARLGVTGRRFEGGPGAAVATFGSTHRTWDVG